MTYLSKFCRQLYFMCKKNGTLQKRYWKSTLFQAVLGPVFVLVLLYGLQQAVNSYQEKLVVNPVATNLGPVPLCTRVYRSETSCVTVMYAPVGDQRVKNIMSAFVELNRLRTSADNSFSDDTATWNPASKNKNWGAVGVASEQNIYEYALSNPNVTSWAVSFDISPAAYNASITNYRYQLWHNVTLVARNYPVQSFIALTSGTLEPVGDQVISVARAIDEAIITEATGALKTSTILDVKLKELPQISENSILKCPRNPDRIFAGLGPVFMFVPMVIIFFTTVNTIAAEKEARLKENLEIIGLYSFVYWLSHYWAGSLLVLINALVTVVVGYAFGFTLFVNADLGVLYVFFLLYGLAYLSMALFVASCCNKVRTAIGFGFFLVILSAIYIGIGFFATYVWYVDPALDPLCLGWIIQIFFPYFQYNKFMRDMFSYTSKKVGFSGGTCKVLDGKPFGWDQVGVPLNFTPGPFDPTDTSFFPLPSQSLWLFVMNIAMYWVLALYFDKVLPNEDGYREHPLYFMMPSYYGRKNPSWFVAQHAVVEDKLSKVRPQPLEKEDMDVAEERKEASALIPDTPDTDPMGLRILGLHKLYNGSKQPAINELSMTVNKGDLLSVLGSNGAGKTSTMKILFGVSPMTSGNAWVFGMNVRTQMREIRKILGVCPQFDVLYPDLTASEHLELFCGIKGIPREESTRMSEERLKHMKLWNVKDQRAGTYSGGMKRRLSVVLSTIGDPKCVFLDEPTTGMDPVNKRYVWSFIEQFKKGRVIVLTTHSMEEADILGDKIAIMSEGRLKAVGNSMHLKNKFGAGYRVSLVIPRSRDAEDVKASIQKVCPKAVLEEEEYLGAMATNPTASKGSNAGLFKKSQDALYGGGAMVRLSYSVLEIRDVKEMVRYLEENQKEHALVGTKSMISGWGMSQTSLEDVFLRMVRPSAAP